MEGLGVQTHVIPVGVLTLAAALAETVVATTMSSPARAAHLGSAAVLVAAAAWLGMITRRSQAALGASPTVARLVLVVLAAQTLAAQALRVLLASAQPTEDQAAAAAAHLAPVLAVQAVLPVRRVAAAAAAVPV